MSRQNKQPVYEEQAASSGAPLLKVLFAIACFGIAVLMVYITVAPPQPSTGMGAIRDVMRGLGGSMCPLLALMMVWIGVLLIFSARGRKLRVINIIANSILFLCAFTAVQLFTAPKIVGTLKLTDFANFVTKSYRHGSGGGAIGSLLAWPLYSSLYQWGGLIVVLLTALLCLVATGRAQKFYNWTMRRAEEGQHHMDQRRKQKNVERLFDYNSGDYDEYDGYAPPQRNPQPQRGIERPARRPARSDRDYMIIETPAPAPEPKSRRKAASPASPASAAASRKKLYKEVIDQETAVEEKQVHGVDIPQPLREIRKKHPDVVTDELPEKKPRRSRSKFPRDIPDFFNIQEDAPAGESAAPAAQPEDEGEDFVPTNYETRKVKPKRVVEGVQPLTIDDIIPQPEPEEDDDDAPFDIPHTTAKKAPVFSRRKEEPAEDEDNPYYYPPIDLLQQGDQKRNSPSHKESDRIKGEKLVATLRSFSVETRLTGISHGPTVTRFELQPAPGVKVSRITALADDIALNLAATSVRIEAPIPGKEAVGVEIPNDKIEMVRLRDVLESPEARNHTSKIAIALGKDNGGRCIIADIAKMPHMLVAGRTGAGKSVCINAIITSILYRATPDEVRMLLIDPKKVELSVYNGIPHLIAPVVDDSKKAASALDWAVAEMASRYKIFQERGVKDIKGYNKSLKRGEKIMPQIVIIIDELADLMMTAPGEVSDSIMRLGQLARAAGVHLVLATQRPSVKVITGDIKTNIPTRVAFQTSSHIDSTTIIDHGGAEKLLGSGDMLFSASDAAKPIRVQGTFVTEEEVNSIVNYIKARSETTYDEDVVEKIENAARTDAEVEEFNEEYDPRLPEAVEIVVEAGQASTSMLQRRMRVGYARAGRLIDEMEKRGIVSPADGSKPREVLISREDFLNMFDD